MIELVLLGVIFLQGILLAYLSYLHQKERTEWTQAMIAKSSTEFNDLKIVERTPAKKKEVIEEEPEYSDLDNFGDEKYLKIISQGVNDGS